MEEQADQALELLESARKAVRQLDSEKTRRQNLSQTELRLKKKLESEQKAVEDEISATVKKRRDEVSASYDREISSAQEALKKLKDDKERAKNAGKRERIQAETAHLREDNRDLTESLKTLYKKNRIPRIARGKWFYIIFMPNGLWDRFVDVCLVLLFWFLLPYAVFTFFGIQEPIVLSIFHLAAFFVFGGAYAVVNSRVKYKYYDLLKQASSLRQKIMENRKKIRIISNSINKDPSEEHYDLDDYNYSIAKAETLVEDIGKKRQEAMQTFDAVTKNVISDEIREGSREKIQQLSADIEANAKELAKSKEAVSKLGMELADKYEGRLGRENLTDEVLEQLLMQIRSGSATNITDAISNYRSNRL